MNYKTKEHVEFEFQTLLENPENATIFHHFKDKEYQIITLALHTEDEQTCVVYQALYGDKKCYVRPAEMFFSKVDKEKYPEVKQEYRFQKVKK